MHKDHEIAGLCPVRGAQPQAARHSTAVMASKESGSAVVDAAAAVWHSIVTPGATEGLMTVFVAVMSLLALPIIFLIVYTEGNIHVLIMTGLWIGLGASMAW